ncbi:MAG: DUF2505 family protein [Acidimicrobiales bacterium]|nr:DUF2505 family protein [Acidimicrobiales bacterium]
MKFEIVQCYAADVDAVQATYLDADFYAQLTTLPAVGGIDFLSQHVDGDVVEQQIRFRFSGNLSAAVRAVLDPAKLTWVDSSVIDRRARRARFRFLPDHYPDRLTCSGVRVLTADGPGCTRQVASAEISVRAPLVGGAIERAIVSGLRENAEAEAAAVERWISR